MTQATSWKLDEAVQLFFIGNEGRASQPPLYSPPLENDLPLHDLEKDLGGQDVRQDDTDGVRAPLPVIRDVLYDSPMLYGYLTFLILHLINHNLSSFIMIYHLCKSLFYVPFILDYALMYAALVKTSVSTFKFDYPCQGDY